MKSFKHSEPFYRYWGKARERPDDRVSTTSYHLLPYHSLDVAAVGCRLLERFLSLRHQLTLVLGLDAQTLKSWVAFFLALHDLGKFSEGFQGLRKDLFGELQGRNTNKGYSVRHDSLGFAIWSNLLSQKLLSLGYLAGEQDAKTTRLWQRGLDFWARASTGHHGRPPKISGPNNLPLRVEDYFTPDDCNSAAEFTLRAADLFLPRNQPNLPSPRDFRDSVKGASWLLAGVSVLCDWIGSNDSYFPYVSEEVPFGDYFEDALARAENALDKAGILPSHVSEFTGTAELFEYIGALSPMQAHVDSLNPLTEPQLHILEDLTGSGKTEAALALAHRIMDVGLADGVFVALPTMATANAMYDRLSQAYRRLFVPDARPSLVLAHSGRHLSAQFRDSILADMNTEGAYYQKDEESAGAMCSAWLADSRKKAFLADVGVGTVDQALLAILPSKHQSLRLLGLFRKVLIVDEVHAYDSYMHVLLKKLLKRQAAQGGSAILLSATLPWITRRELITAFAEGLGKTEVLSDSPDEYPLATHVYRSKVDAKPVPSRFGLCTKVQVELVNEQEAVYRRILEEAHSGFCVCWVRNTVPDAMESYHKLLEMDFPSDRLLLFHARYVMGDRLKIEERVLKSFGKHSTATVRKGKILVATQVVEQSLDLDFDFMVSDLAPIDLIIQRAGRLHRHARDANGNLLVGSGNADQRGEPLLMICSPDPVDEPGEDWYSLAFPRASRVYYHHGELWRTARLLKERGGWIFPDDARTLIEGVYGEDAEPVPEELFASCIQAEGQRSAEASLAYFNALDPEEGYIDTMSSWTQDTVTPTRIGEANTTVRLAKWDGHTLLPWSDSEEHAWEMSQVSVRESWIKNEASHSDKKLRQACRKAKASMPDQGKWSVLVPLVHDLEGRWAGVAVGGNNNEARITYSPMIGLEVFWKGEGHGV